jgi:hypothetical protein
LSRGNLLVATTAGHYQGTAAARDAVKKEALRKAGIRYLEVSVDDNAEQIRSRVREQLGWRPRLFWLRQPDSNRGRPSLFSLRRNRERGDTPSKSTGGL